MRRHNEEMKLALAESLPLAEARWRLFQARIREIDGARETRLAAIDDENRRRRNERLCGTVAPVESGEKQRESRSDATPDRRPRFWWQDERL